MEIFTGVVESRMDPLKLGRCQVRIHGLHTHDKTQLPTSDLPWAFPMGDITSASISGIGRAPVGVVEGTVVLVFFRDADKQQPIMMGTLGGIPQADNMAVDADSPELMFDEQSTNSSKAAEIPVVTTEGTTAVPSTPAPAPAPAPKPSVTGIPGNSFGPREGSSVKIKGSSIAGIQAVGRAMDAAGITSSYARAAILGIIGGESEWVPQNEGFKYSKDRIKAIFSWMTEDNVNTYANWKGSREDFFRFVYGPSTRSGKNLGNKGADDGANYYGRGYVQLTGAYNYNRYAKQSGVDIVGNPNLMNDPEQGAKVSVAYFKDRVKVPQNDPGYFDAACQAVGFNTPDIKAKKKAYYQYFLIADAKASDVPQQQEQSAVPGEQPPNVKIAESGFPVDRQVNLVLGFRDPNMKYPLREFLNEPDTNRIARGRVEGTPVQTRDNSRMTSIPTADLSTWSQPPIPYNARYPFNRMEASESGHLIELDDTPDNERVNVQHRTGSFLEMDCNGTQVNRIVGDGYEIIDRNGYVYVKGAYNITSEGFTTIYVNADAHIRVAGHTQIDLEQDLDMNVARDFNLNVGGNWKIDVGGWEHKIIGKDRSVNIGDTDTLIVTNDQTINIGGSRTDKIAKDNQTNIDGDNKLVVGGKMDWDVTGNYTAKIGGDEKFDVSGKFDLKIGGAHTLQVGANWNRIITGAKMTTAASSMDMIAGVDATISSAMVMSAGSMSMVSTSGDTVINSGGNTRISSTGTYTLKTSGDYAVDANTITFNNGVATNVPGTSITPVALDPVSSADSVKKAEPATKMPTASPPDFGNPASNRFQNLTTPPRNFEIDSSFETPEEIATETGTAFHKKRDTEIVGSKGTPENTTAAEVTPVAAANAQPARDYQAEIDALLAQSKEKSAETKKYMDLGYLNRDNGNEESAMANFRIAEKFNKEGRVLIDKAKALDIERKGQPVSSSVANGASTVADKPASSGTTTPTEAAKPTTEVAKQVTITPVKGSPAKCDLIYTLNDFPLSMKLSTSFTIADLIRDPKHILADQMLQDSRGSAPRKYTKQEIVCNLKGLAENIMEPLIDLVPGGRKGFTITSGYRYAGLTANESKVSDHPKGNACDIILTGKNFDYQAHYELAGKLAAALPFHQLILEYRDAGRPGNSRGKRIVWIHIAHRYVGAAKQAFTMLNDKTYGQGFSLLDK